MRTIVVDLYLTSRKQKNQQMLNLLRCEAHKHTMKLWKQVKAEGNRIPNYHIRCKPDRSTMIVSKKKKSKRLQVGQKEQPVKKRIGRTEVLYMDLIELEMGLIRFFDKSLADKERGVYLLTYHSPYTLIRSMTCMTRL